MDKKAIELVGILGIILAFVGIGMKIGSTPQFATFVSYSQYFAIVGALMIIVWMVAGIMDAKKEVKK